MNRDSKEYKQFCAEYEATQKERRENPNQYPYFAYFMFGFHRMTFMTEEEVDEAVNFYHLKSDGKGGYFRYGRQPIMITLRPAITKGEE